MTDEQVAQALAALGHESRLKVFRVLVRAGPEGVNAGALGRVLEMPASTLAHHLRALCAGGLATQERRGRETVNRADYAALRRVFAHLEDQCCAGVADAAMAEETR